MSIRKIADKITAKRNLYHRQRFMWQLPRVASISSLPADFDCSPAKIIPVEFPESGILVALRKKYKDLVIWAFHGSVRDVL